MEIRKVASEDGDVYWALRREFGIWAARHGPRYFRWKPELGDPKKRFARMRRDRNYAAWLAWAGGIPVGLVGASFQRRKGDWIMRPMNIVFITMILVRPRWRGQGIGKALLQTAKDWAVKRKCTDLQLTVQEFNEKGKSFYKSMGFKGWDRLLSLNLRKKK